MSKLRELRGRNGDDCMHAAGPIDSEAIAQGRCTVLPVTVPSNAVGLIIGPKGSRVREIAESTSTYIKTPCRYREPIFEIYGHPSDVTDAKDKIMSYVHEQVDDEYIKQWMTQLPIHEPGSPVKPSQPVLPIVSPSALPQADFTDLTSATAHNFTRLRPFSPQLMSPITGAQMFSDLSSYPQTTGRPMSPLNPYPQLVPGYPPRDIVPPFGSIGRDERLSSYGISRSSPQPPTTTSHWPMDTSMSPLPGNSFYRDM